MKPNLIPSKYRIPRLAKGPKSALPRLDSQRLNRSIDIVDLWDICLQFEYDQPLLISSISQWIKQVGGRKILDAACGTGFPALDLIERGFDVTCCDGSPAMLEKFRINAATRNVAVTPRLLLWNGLGSAFPNEFDLVMCRGSSLIYAGTWDVDAKPQRIEMERALTNFYDCLRPGGLIYVDTTAAKNLDRSHFETNSYKDRLINGMTVSLSENIRINIAEQTRNWTSNLTINGLSFAFTRTSHYLTHNELLDMLKRVGFVDIAPLDMTGEHYAVFTATR